MTTPRKARRKQSIAQDMQIQHWSRTGGITAMIGLIEYHKTRHVLPMKVAQALSSAQGSLRVALTAESRNNEFIHLNLQPSWKKAG